MAKEKKGKKEFTPSSLKLLAALLVLQKEGLSGSKEGVYCFLTGRSDLDQFHTLPLYGSLLSLGKIRCTHIINSLVEKECLRVASFENGGSIYLVLTKRGEALAEEFLMKKGARENEEKPGRMPRYITYAVAKAALDKQ